MSEISPDKKYTKMTDKKWIFKNLKSLTSHFLEQAGHSDILVQEKCLTFLTFLGIISDIFLPF